MNFEIFEIGLFFCASTLVVCEVITGRARDTRLLSFSPLARPRDFFLRLKKNWLPASQAATLRTLTSS